MRVSAYFQVFCPRGRRHRVTAYRITEYSPNGLSVQTKLYLTGGAEVKRVAAGRYEADGFGLLVRPTWVVSTPRRGGAPLHGHYNPEVAGRQARVSYPG